MVQIDLEIKNDVLIFRICGDIDINTSPEIKKSFDKVIKENNKRILVNLGKVDYLDSSGLATFVEILKHLRTCEGQLKLTNLSRKIKGLFEITKLDKLFDISNEESTALESFNK